NGKVIDLARIEHPAAQLGRLAERDRQHARRERVERPAMADLDLAQPRLAADALHRADRLRRAEPHGFVQYDPAVHRSAARAAGYGLSILRRLFGFTRGLALVLRRRRGRCDERGQGAAFTPNDDRCEPVEPPRAARFDADRLREIDLAADAGESAIIPVAATVL